jgi:transglutaminase-like putative cysteine protease
MKLRIHHHTHYRYSEALLYSVQNLLLWPSHGPSQQVLSWVIDVPTPLQTLPNGLGNHSHTFTLEPTRPLRDLHIVAQGVVQTLGVSSWQEAENTPHASFYLRPSTYAEPHPRMTDWARTVVPKLAHTVGTLQSVARDDVLALAQAVAQKVRYRSGSTGVETTALEAFDWELGVCQDQAHVMLAVCRSLGLAARYVSGYLYAENAPELASHAWVDVCLNPAQRHWFSVDVTHACPMDERYVRLAVGSDYSSTAPVKGMRRGGAQESMVVRVSVDPISDEPDC